MARIVSCIAGNYGVISDGELYTLKARGNFRIGCLKPVVGDYIDFDKDKNIITKILERFTDMFRTICNVTSDAVVAAIIADNENELNYELLCGQKQEERI